MPPNNLMALLQILFGAGFTLAAAYSLGRLCLRPLRTPSVMALPVGAAILSLLVYFLLLTGWAEMAAFIALGICALLPMVWRDRRPKTIEKHERVDRITASILAVIFVAYGVLYLVHALAPELQPDAVGYHLGMPAEYLRLGAFPDRIDFYGMLPQGMEMLYLFAMAFGAHSAAKLVHFAFLIATAPVLLALGRRLGISDTVCWVAAAFYFCAPVVAISGTCAYTDAALVCCILATIYFLVAWRQEGDAMYLISAGLLAGFCYAIKLNALLIPVLGVLFVLVACWRTPKVALASSALLAAASAIMILPWMIRSVALTGNPVAPLFNAWFPNPYFLVSIERGLAKFMNSYAGFTFRNAWWELTMGGASHGIVGPLFLLLPVGLLALRYRAGRWVWLAGGLLALPWFINVGTRFLMPSLAFFALALAMTLPKPVAWAALAFHAVACWPAVVATYERPGLWRLDGFPWRAALRVQPELDYLRGALWDYRVAEMIKRNTRRHSRILGLIAVADAYTDREVMQYWQSALAVRVREELLEAYYAEKFPLYDWSAHWKEQRLLGMRFRIPAAAEFEWEIHEIDILRGEDRIRVDQDWRTGAWPNLFEAPFAFDGSQATRWRTWDPVQPGMFLDVDFGRPEIVSGASLTTHWLFPQLEMYGKGLDGRWIPLTKYAKAEPRRGDDLRKQTVVDLKRAGFEYIVTPVSGASGNGPLGKYLFEHASEWGIVDVGSFDTVRLLKL
jgi:4-amino-4-deoxy-L-arabinose transferase-like glycosyltransferase